MVDLELYRVFKIVADEENITKASEILHISQPAVTKHIRNLEQELNVKLFDRTKYGMALTDEGRKLYMHIKESINILSNAEDILTHSAQINFGVHTNLTRGFYSTKISEFRKVNPDVTINILKTYTQNMFSLMEKQEVDVFLTKKFDESLYNSESIEFISLGYFHDQFIVNENSKYLNKEISASNFDIPVIYTLTNVSSTYTNLLRALNDNNISAPEIKNMTFNSIIELLKDEDIVAVITGEYIEEELKNKKYQILNTGINLEPIEYGIYYNKKNKLRDIKKIIEYFKNN